ncbi:MAG: hypothetical protein BBJ57_08150 [Desulfobacterales bacterium PC51MH44]|nr:MAG: hypothetical protein BBJ57_08150 [Desulfobacterales bacterium PC51MH44]
MKITFKIMVYTALLCALAFIPCMAEEPSDAAEKRAGGVKSLEKRIKQLEDAIGRDVEGDKWYDRIQIGGLVEVEAGYEKIDFKDPAAEDETTSDVDLATVELVVDAKVAKHVDGHVMFKYEEEEVFVDEGFITLVGTEKYPAYLIAGRQYIPFGYFDSFFVTDPTTLILGETNEGALVGGYRFGGEMVDIAVGAYNGKTKKFDSDNTISNFVGSIVVAPKEGIMVGASYTSNLAAADSFADLVQTDLNDFVGGWSAFVTASFFKIKLIGEYVGAVDEFEAGELYNAADTQKRQPAAWNVELGFAITEAWEITVRYGGSTDGDAGGGEFLPESQYGAVVNWGLFESTNLALEYLHADFQDDYQISDTIVAQLAIEF